MNIEPGPNSRIVIRPMNSSPEWNEIALVNELLRAAYSAESAASFAASNEDVEATKRRVREGECYLALLDGVLIACIVLRVKSKPTAPTWYQRPGVASIGRFAVRPDLQKQGIASTLLEFVEKRAKQLGCSELALDTAESAEPLIRFYEKRGYRIVSSHQWNRTPFKSVVLSKSI